MTSAQRQQEYIKIFGDDIKPCTEAERPVLIYFNDKKGNIV
jgi:hypothetical protein